MGQNVTNRAMFVFVLIFVFDLTCLDLWEMPFVCLAGSVEVGQITEKTFFVLFYLLQKFSESPFCPFENRQSCLCW